MAHSSLMDANFLYGAPESLELHVKLLVGARLKEVKASNCVTMWFHLSAGSNNNINNEIPLGTRGIK